MGDKKPEPGRGGGRSGAAIGEMFGHVNVLSAVARPWFTGFTAGLMLRNDRTRDILLIGSEHRLQTVLETGLVTGYEVKVDATKAASTAMPGGGAATGELFEVLSATVYNHK